MNRLDVISKTMVKLGMLGDPRDPIPDNKKTKLLKLLWNEQEPKNVVNLLGSLFKEKTYSTEAKQDLFKFFKLKGLFKRSLKQQGMEKAWRFLLKEHRLRGFLLEN